MATAIDLTWAMQEKDEGKILDYFANPDNPKAHYECTGPEIWRDTEQKISHFVSSMGTMGTILGTSRFLKEQNLDSRIIGVQPKDGAKIPRIRRWPEEPLLKIYDTSRVDRIIDVDQPPAEQTSRDFAIKEGIFSGIPSGGAVSAVFRLSEELENAIIVVIICDRRDRYLSTGVFPD